MIKNPKLISLLGLSVFALMAFSLYLYLNRTPSAKLREHLGDEIIAILNGANRVETFRVDPDVQKAKGQPADKVIGDFLITGHGPEYGSSFAQKLEKALMQDDTYFHNVAIMCFWPRVAYRFWKEDRSVDVVICFHCRNLSVGMTGSSLEHQQLGNSTDAMREVLVQLTKEAFPDDQQIQALKAPYPMDPE